MNADLDVEAAVRQILIEDLGVSAADIRNDARLVEELGIDSVDAVEMLIAAENRFDIELDEAAFREARTVNDLVVLFREQLERQRTTTS